MDVKTLGIDLGKSVFHVVGLDERGAIALKRRVTRTQLGVLVGNLPRCVVAMEACPGSHHMARRLAEHGHTVRLLPPQYVRPYVKTNKNDFRDAEAIAEAVGRGTMRFVPPKTSKDGPCVPGASLCEASSGGSSPPPRPGSLPTWRAS